MRGTLSLLTAALAAILIGGCAMHSGTAAPKAAAAMPSEADMRKAKKLNMPIIIYSLGIEKDKEGKSSRPVVYFVNTSNAPVSLVTFHIKGQSADGSSVTLWADDYEKVTSGHSSQNGAIGGSWARGDIDCIEIVEAGLHVGNNSMRYHPGVINQLFFDPSVNTCK